MSNLPLASANLVRPERNPSHETQARRRSTGNLTARLAIDPQTRADAFAVRYESYASGGYIDFRADGLFSDDVDDLPNSQTVVIYKHGRPVASVRTCVLDTDPAMQGWNDIPALRIFPQELGGMMAAVNAARRSAALPATDKQTPLNYARAIEINRLVRHPDFRNDSELVFILFRFGNYMILHHDADMFLSCVRGNHMPFYRRVCKMESVAGPRRYHGVSFETHLMACERQKYDALIKRVPIFGSDNILQAYAPMLDGETVNVFGDQ